MKGINIERVWRFKNLIGYFIPRRQDFPQNGNFLDANIFQNIKILFIGKRNKFSICEV